MTWSTLPRSLRADPGDWVSVNRPALMHWAIGGQPEKRKAPGDQKDARLRAGSKRPFGVPDAFYLQTTGRC